MNDGQGRRPLPSRLMRNPWLLLSTSSIVWSGNVVAARMAAGEISPMVLVALRWLLVVLLLAVFLYRQLPQIWRALKPHAFYLLVMGSLGFTISNAMLYEGARYTSGVNVAIIQGVLPVLVLIGARLVYGTRAGPLRMFGVALTLIGIAFVAMEGDPQRLADMHFNKGDAWAFASSALYAAFTVALHQRPTMSALTFFVGLSLGACVSALIGMGLEIQAGAAQWPDWRGILVLIYVAVFTSIMGQVFWIRAVEIIGPGRAGVFQNLVPVLGALMSVVLLREDFVWYHAASLALVLGGIVLSEFGKKD
jgi:drug/metabolite transporter (DMT)-like permease